MSAVLEVFSTAAIVAGMAFFVAGTAGVLRFPDTMTRLHALTKADNLGLGFIVLGLLPRIDSVASALKLVVAWLLVLFAGAVVSQLVARVARKQESER